VFQFPADPPQVVPRGGGFEAPEDPFHPGDLFVRPVARQLLLDDPLDGAPDHPGLVDDVAVVLHAPGFHVDENDVGQDEDDDEGRQAYQNDALSVNP